MTAERGDPAGSGEPDEPGDGRASDRPAAEPPHDAELVFAYPTAERARIVARSARQEVGEIEGERTRATVARDGPRVVVRVAAEDLVALRAGLNTWTSLVEVAERTAVAADR